jgi:hypothetical protein
MLTLRLLVQEQLYHALIRRRICQFLHAVDENQGDVRLATTYPDLRGRKADISLLEKAD